MNHQVNWNRQLGLALALFLLGTAAYWLEFKHKPEKEASEEQSKRIFQLKDHPIQSLKLSDGNKVFSFTCSDLSAQLCKPGDNSKWEVTEPVKMKADDTNVNALISTLNTLNSSETIDLKDETPEKRAALLKEYGLDSQTRSSSKQVELVTSSGMTHLYLGATHPIGEGIFALEGHENADENHVYLIPSYFKANLDHDLSYWRNKKLLTLSAHEIESFKLAGTTSKLSPAPLSAERKEGQWILHVKNEDFSGDIENIDSLLSGATALTAKEFASESKADAKAKSILKPFGPVLSLTLQKEKGSAKEAPEPVTLTLFQKKGTAQTQVSPASAKIYATVSNLDPLFELDSSALQKLDKSTKELRLAKLITTMERFSAKELEFSGASLGASPLILKNTDGKWLRSGDPEPVSGEKVQDFLDKLSGNRIKEFLTGSAIPSGEKDGLKVTLSADKNEAKRELVFWKKNDKLFARDLKSKRNEVFQLDPTLQTALPWNRDFFKKPEVKPETKPETKPESKTPTQTESHPQGDTSHQ